MKRFAILILALCLVLALTACDPAQIIKDKLAESVGEELPELGEIVGQLTEGWKFGQLIYDETDGFSIDENGVVSRTHTETRYSYDDNGNQTLYDVTTTDADGTTSTSRTEQVYDENSNLLKLINTTSDGDTVTTEYTYDSEGRDIQQVSTYADGTQSVSTTEYDAEGRVTLSEYFGTDGDHNKSVYVYDEKGNEVYSEWESTYGEEHSVSKTEQTFDDDGNMLRRVTVSNGGGENVAAYEYDAEGRMLKETYTDEDGTSYTTEYTYDANGNATDEVNTYNDGSTSTTHREYDANGNLLRTAYQNSEYRYEDVYEYDANGCVAYNRYDSWSGEAHSFSVVLYTNDDDGRTLTRTFYDSTGTIESESNAYDMNGYLIKATSTRMNSDGTGYSLIQKSEYDFGEPLG